VRPSDFRFPKEKYTLPALSFFENEFYDLCHRFYTIFSASGGERRREKNSGNEFCGRDSFVARVFPATRLASRFANARVPSSPPHSIDEEIDDSLTRKIVDRDPAAGGKVT